MIYLIRQYHKWLDISLTTFDELGNFIRDWIRFVRNYDRLGYGLPRITDQQCQCLACGWVGTVYDCEGDIDDDGSLGCPECLNIVEVMIYE